MLLDAQRAFNIDMSRSWMVGDKQSDILAGKEAGVGKTVLVGDSASSHGSEADFHIEKISQMEALVRRFGC
ncbi:D-glycero-alpha-D-manno-heptose-1,7-bisphosphate 7-phosphatase [compost metagenome]